MMLRIIPVHDRSKRLSISRYVVGSYWPIFCLSGIIQPEIVFAVTFSVTNENIFEKVMTCRKLRIETEKNFFELALKHSLFGFETVCVTSSVTGHWRYSAILARSSGYGIRYFGALLRNLVRKSAPKKPTQTMLPDISKSLKRVFWGAKVEFLR